MLSTYTVILLCLKCVHKIIVIIYHAIKFQLYVQNPRLFNSDGLLLGLLQHFDDEGDKSPF